jgi:hypothetical protein
MISDRALDRAVEQGVITAGQAETLRAIERASGTAPSEPVDDEKLRFVSGFGDVFVTIGIFLFLSSLASFAAAAGIAITAALIAAASWALAEFFTRRRRMALPSIVLLLAFAGGVFVFLYAANGAIVGGPHGGWVPSFWQGADLIRPSVGITASLLTAVAVAIHYARFRVPITVAVGVAALVWTALGLLFLLWPGLTLSHVDHAILLGGLVVFCLAMSFDMADPHRRTRRTDIAFWLHFLAAPMIVHSLIGGIIWRGGGFDTLTALEVLAAFLGLGVVAVLVDRRAILVAGLTYAGTAFGILLAKTGFSDNGFATSLLILGAFVLLLSAGWRPLRGMLLNLLPPALARRLPNPGIAVPS